MIRGSCLCGSVCSEVRGLLKRATNCYWSQCRKANGAAFGTYVRANWADFSCFRVKMRSDCTNLRRAFGAQFADGAARSCGSFVNRGLRVSRLRLIALMTIRGRALQCISL